jgi:hypothetical protein
MRTRYEIRATADIADVHRVFRGGCQGRMRRKVRVDGLRSRTDLGPMCPHRLPCMTSPFELEQPLWLFYCFVRCFPKKASILLTERS